MFLKRCTRQKDGKPHTYWQLVESYRTPRGPRHRVVAYLGELDKGERRGWGRLALHLDGKAAGRCRQLMLFDDVDTEPDDPVPPYVEVDLKAIRIERTRDFGDIFLALSLWRILGLDEFFSQKLPAGREEVSFSLMASRSTSGLPDLSSRTASCMWRIPGIAEPSWTGCWQSRSRRSMPHAYTVPWMSFCR